MKRIWIITLFPEYFEALKSCGVIGKVLSGERSSKIELNILKLSDYSPKGFKGVDSAVFGGGPGVVIRADVLQNAILDGVVSKGGYDKNRIKDQLKIIYTSPRGHKWNNELARSFGESLVTDTRDLVFICGRYEGIDERFIENYIDEIFSLGDFVLSGGDLAVMAIIDSSLRFSQGTLGNHESARNDSFEDLLIEGPCYTRPQEFEGLKVPQVLLSGDHKKIKQYNHSKKIEMTKYYRADLYKKYLENERNNE